MKITLDLTTAERDAVHKGLLLRARRADEADNRALARIASRKLSVATREAQAKAKRR